MKIRNGFVSNSSSSSFCMFGTTVDRSEVRDLIRKANVTLQDHEQDLDSLRLYELREILEYNDELKFPKGLSVWRPEGSDRLYIGKSWSSVKDDQTGKQFKDDVQADLKQFFGKDMSCTTHSEAWYG